MRERLRYASGKPASGKPAGGEIRATVGEAHPGAHVIEGDAAHTCRSFPAAPT